MGTIFLGSEALARGEMTRGRLRWSYQAIYPDVYMPRIAERTLYTNTVGAWLWSRRRAVITGRAAAALHGARWIGHDTPVELIWDNCHPPRGIVTRDERFTCDEVVEFNGMAVTTIQRTAFDLGRHLRRDRAVGHLDALARETGLAREHVLPLTALYRGARGVRRLGEALDLMDAGAQSPKETWLRLLLIDAGFPRPTTQIPVIDGGCEPFAFLDMGWREAMIAVEYDGDHHRTVRAQFTWDIKRLRRLQELGWIHVRVIAEDRPVDVLDRVRRAWARREAEGWVAKTRA